MNTLEIDLRHFSTEELGILCNAMHHAIQSVPCPTVNNGCHTCWRHHVCATLNELDSLAWMEGTSRPDGETLFDLC